MRAYINDETNTCSCSSVIEEATFDFGLTGEWSDAAPANELELLRRLGFNLDICWNAQQHEQYCFVSEESYGINRLKIATKGRFTAAAVVVAT
jgi:hypothetical protein